MIPLFSEYEDKIEMLENIIKQFKEHGGVAVAFSGGVDSTFLLYTAKQILDDKVVAIIVNGSAMPERDLIDAVDFCNEYDIKYDYLFNLCLCYSKNTKPLFIAT